MSKQKLTKKQKEELQSLVDEITFEAKELRLDYENNNSELCGMVVHIHDNSPFLDVNENDERTYSGSRWRHVIKTK